MIVGGWIGWHKFPIPFKKMEALKLCAVKEFFPYDLASLICDFAKPAPAPYDSWEPWDPIPEYDIHGNYGHLPMCPVGAPVCVTS